jgi:hypothetical protein
LRDFHRQKVLNAALCHLTKVTGLTTTSALPVEEFCERDHGETKSGRCPARLRLPFLKQGELFSQEQILGDQGNTSGNEQPNQRWQSRILQELVGFAVVPTELLRSTGQADRRMAPRLAWSTPGISSLRSRRLTI